MSCSRKFILDNAIKLLTLIHRPNFSLLNNNLLCTPALARNCWMKATAVSVIGQKLRYCWGIYSMYERIPSNFFSIYLEMGFWGAVSSILWGLYLATDTLSMQITNSGANQNAWWEGFFSGTVAGACAGGHLESQQVVNSLFGSPAHGWAHQLGRPQLPCGAHIKQQQSDLDFTAFEVILKTVQGGVRSLQML